MKPSGFTSKIVAVVMLGCAALVAACGLRRGGAALARDPLPLSSVDARNTDAAGRHHHVQAMADKLPLYFVENRGQDDAQVAFYVHGRDTAVYFTGTGSPSR